MKRDFKLKYLSFFVAILVHIFVFVVFKSVESKVLDQENIAQQTLLKKRKIKGVKIVPRPQLALAPKIFPQINRKKSLGLKVSKKVSREKKALKILEKGLQKTKNKSLSFKEEPIVDKKLIQSIVEQSLYNGFEDALASDSDLPAQKKLLTPQLKHLDKGSFNSKYLAVDNAEIMTNDRFQYLSFYRRLDQQFGQIMSPRVMTYLQNKVKNKEHIAGGQYLSKFVVHLDEEGELSKIKWVKKTRDATMNKIAFDFLERKELFENVPPYLKNDQGFYEIKLSFMFMLEEQVPLLRVLSPEG